MTACKSNLRNLATALEMYASDNQGRYPVHVTALTTGNYLKLIPTCPAAKSDTYSASYLVSSKPDLYTYYCLGDNHKKALGAIGGNSTNFPQFTSEQGLIANP